MLQTALALNPPATDPDVPATDPDVPALVVFGLGTDGKPRASWYAKEDGSAAKAAARKMDVRVLAVTSAEKTALALRVPKGRIFSSGKAFMPLIQREVFDGLEKLAPADKPKLKLVASSSGDSKGAEPASKDDEKLSDATKNAGTTLPPDWAHISGNSLVLAYSVDDEAWFEAVVVGAGMNGSFTLRWRDYPDEPEITCKRHELALMFPSKDAAAGA